MSDTQTSPTTPLMDAVRFRELVEAAYDEAPRPLILDSYDHGGGRFVGLRLGQPGTQRLVADFYEPSNRDLYAFIETHLREILRIVEAVDADGESPPCLVCEGWGAYCDRHRPEDRLTEQEAGE